jgi:hypothetical protein
MKLLNFSLAVLLAASINYQVRAKDLVTLFSDNGSEQIQFAISEIQNALSQRDLGTALVPASKNSRFNAGEYNIVLLNINEEATAQLVEGLKVERINELKGEGFIIHRSGRNNNVIWILAKDDAGVMYGGLEAAELIRIGGPEALEDQFQNPYMKVRGTKFNIPLDMRSPTYTEPSDAAQKNMAEMWNFEFWKEYIDNLARNRFNLISLWSMHPFPSMVKVPDYPEVALSDVRRSTGNWKENYSLNGWGFDAPEIMESYEVVKKMTIEDKIEFWRKVMDYGRQRNVRFYVITWNIFVYGVDGKYGITDKLENQVTTDYFRKSVKQMVLTYPDLAGIGLTTGENMYDYSATQKEEWAFATYGQGVLDALKEQPGRKIDFIHRQHQTQAKEISSIFKELMENENINFLFSFKYAQAHVYSSVNQVFHEGFVKDIQSENLKTLWTLRNDDNYIFRWGAPDFVRDFIRNIPYDVSEGFYYGSDQYVWGREFMAKNEAESGELELVKHWYQWMCWGRLGYNPNLENQRFVDVIRLRFPSVNAKEMFDAWQSASMIYPMVTGFHWGALDFQWYIESGQSQAEVAKTPSGYHDAGNFINLPPHKGTGNISIPGYVKAVLSGNTVNGITPLQLAENIIRNADFALSWAENQEAVNSPGLRITIDDIKAMSWLGKYYAHKIKAATYLALLRETFKKEWHEKTIAELNLSAGYWRHYAAIGLFNYKNPLWTNRVGLVDWKENFKWAVYEVLSNGGSLNMPSMQATPGGSVMEAEDVCTDPTLPDSRLPGFTGKGYTGKGEGHARYRLDWEYQAPEPGRYILELRYTLNRNDVSPFALEINNNKVRDVEFWSTGNAGTWVWERVAVNLEKGNNKISISPEAFVLIDHLNIVKF